MSKTPIERWAEDIAGSFAAGWAWATIRYIGSSDE